MFHIYFYTKMFFSTALFNFNSFNIGREVLLVVMKNFPDFQIFHKPFEKMCPYMCFIKCLFEKHKNNR